MAIGKRIQDRLDSLEWQRKDLLEKVPGLTQQALSNLILRDSKRSEWDEAIAEALGIHVMELVYGKSPPLGVAAMAPAPHVHPDKTIAQVVALMESTDITGRMACLAAVNVAMASYTPEPKAKRA